MNQPVPTKLGKYEVLSLLGAGAQASVYRARQPGLEREVAIKVIAFGGTAAADFLARFEQEAQVSARLEHPNILPVHDCGQQDGFAYFVMRLVRGGTLAQRMAQGRVPDAEALAILEQIARALDHAHSLHVVHRDVKPANILLSGDGQALLSDFGIAKLLEGSTLQSEPGSNPCTPAYASPDPLAGEAPDGRSDQYSLAVIAYELLDGKRPFNSDSARELIYQHAAKPPPFSGSWFDARPQVVHALRRALAKEREQRFDSCLEFVSALRAGLEAAPAQLHELETREHEADHTHSSSPPPLPNSAPPPKPVAESRPAPCLAAPAIAARRSHARAWALATLGVGLLVAGVGYAGSWISADETPVPQGPGVQSETTPSAKARKSVAPWTSFPLTITVDESIRSAATSIGLPSVLSQDLVPAFTRELRASGLLQGDALYDPNAKPEVLGSSTGGAMAPTELSDRVFVVLGIAWKRVPRPQPNEAHSFSDEEHLYSVCLSAKLVFGGEERALCSPTFVQSAELPARLDAATGPTLQAHSLELARMLASSTAQELRSILELGVQRTFVIVGPAGSDCDLREVLAGIDGLVDAQRVSDARVRPTPERVTLEPFEGTGGLSFPVDASAAISVWNVRYRAPTVSTLEALSERLRQHLDDIGHHVDIRRGIKSQAFVVAARSKT